MRLRTMPGYTLVELLVGMTLGLVVAAAAVSTFLAAQAAYLVIADRILLEERGQRALAVITLLLRQAGWRMAPAGAATAAVTAFPAVSGADNCGQPAIGPLPSCARAGVGRSDALLVRFDGSGLPGALAQPDQTMTDCSGYGVAAQQAGPYGTPDYVAANLIYVTAGSDGVPQLLCRYPTRRQGTIDGTGWTSGALVRGVESLQFRYGLDTDGDGVADRYEPAATIQAQGAAAWERVLAVQVALAVRGDRPGSAAGQENAEPPPPAGSAAADLDAAGPGVPGTARRVFATTVRLRNLPRCQDTLC
ncbi:PilW family protein [Cupriavidus sp. amp6]|uniref:PilW family protein n=1 Tax=Cupriavidus sp. amp6 TaxID=388051 RepID=UPI00048E772B|nr:PilW family protein [Cupriavidus sp. amp6]